MTIVATMSSIIIVYVTTDYQLSAVFLQVLMYFLNQIPVLHALACAIVNPHITTKIPCHLFTITCLPSISHLHSQNKTTRRFKKNANTAHPSFHPTVHSVQQQLAVCVTAKDSDTRIKHCSGSGEGEAGECLPHTQSWRLQRGSTVSTCSSASSMAAVRGRCEMKM